MNVTIGVFYEACAKIRPATARAVLNYLCMYRSIIRIYKSSCKRKPDIYMSEVLDIKSMLNFDLLRVLFNFFQTELLLRVYDKIFRLLTMYTIKKQTTVF